MTATERTFPKVEGEAKYTSAVAEPAERVETAIRGVVIEYRESPIPPIRLMTQRLYKEHNYIIKLASDVITTSKVPAGIIDLGIRRVNELKSSGWVGLFKIEPPSTVLITTEKAGVIVKYYGAYYKIEDEIKNRIREHLSGKFTEEEIEEAIRIYTKYHGLQEIVDDESILSRLSFAPRTQELVRLALRDGRSVVYSREKLIYYLVFELIGPLPNNVRADLETLLKLLLTTKVEFVLVTTNMFARRFKKSNRVITYVWKYPDFKKKEDSDMWVFYQATPLLLSVKKKVSLRYNVVFLF